CNTPPLWARAMDENGPPMTPTALNATVVARKVRRDVFGKVISCSSPRQIFENSAYRRPRTESRPHSALAGQTPAEAYAVGLPVDIMDKPDGLPTSPQVQQQQQNVINRVLAA
ncbi:MAG: hypothetical protein VCD33_14715, partial [Alphaproteobacteria bacterium]